MGDRVLAPIVIGVTGKRDLNGRDEWVRNAMRRLFQRLDDEFRDTPKVLLSALAEGSDTIAAEEALERKHWQVVARLPLALDLYLEDFSEAGADRLRTILRDPRVKSEPLHSLLDKPDGKALEAEALHRNTGASNPHRTDHYEQVGLFIADRATVLIAVMPSDEKPGRIGGTARIVHFRLNGPFDDTVKDILARSRELLAPNLLDTASSGPVWLVDLAATGSSGEFPATVLLPSDWEIGKATAPRRLVGMSLVLADRLHRFNRRALDLSADRWKSSVVGRAGADTGDATAMLKYLRLAMSAIQGDANTWRKRSVFILAGLFSAAAAVVELREGFERARGWWWGLYLLFGVIAVVIYWLASRGFWQQISEDYRAVAEALRVQIAWWEAGLCGLDHRVERFFLCGTSGSLALVRSAVRHCVNTAVLTRPGPTRVVDSEAKWTGGQISFFETRIAQRRKYLLAADASTWVLFLGALGAAAFLTLILLAPPAGKLITDAIESSWRYLPEGTLFLCTVIVLTIVSVVAIWLEKGGILHRVEHRHPAGRLAAIAVVLLLGMSFAATFDDFEAFWLKGHPLDAARDPKSIPLGEALAGLFAVAPAAIAGAIRYVAERLSWEAELHGYEDTLRTFRLARMELAAIESAPIDIRAKSIRRDQLLLALGKEALEESEAWIRAHRERTIEPVV